MLPFLQLLQFVKGKRLIVKVEFPSDEPRGLLQDISHSATASTMNSFITRLPCIRFVFISLQSIVLSLKNAIRVIGLGQGGVSFEFWPKPLLQNIFREPDLNSQIKEKWLRSFCQVCFYFPILFFFVFTNFPFWAVVHRKEDSLLSILTALQLWR